MPVVAISEIPVGATVATVSVTTPPPLVYESTHFLLRSREVQCRRRGGNESAWHQLMTIGDNSMPISAPARTTQELTVVLHRREPFTNLRDIEIRVQDNYSCGFSVESQSVPATIPELCELNIHTCHNN